MPKARPLRGNALFIILLCIVLFAALTYAVSGNFRANSSLSQTKVEALASDIVLSAASVEKAVNKMLVQGISESRISFTRNGSDGYQLSPVQNDAERVFSSQGGGAQWLDPSGDELDQTKSALTGFGSWAYTGYMHADGHGTDGAGESTKELLAVLPYVRKDICIAINKRMGIDNPSGNPPKESSNMRIDKYQGAYSSGTVSLSVNSARTFGFKAGCIEGNTLGSGSVDVSGSYFFYYVLIAR